MEDVAIDAIIPKTRNPSHLLKFIFMKDLQTIRSFEEQNSCSVNRQENILEIQAKTRESLQSTVTALKNYIRSTVKNLYFDSLDIPVEHHGFVIGKGGQNIIKIKQNEQWNSRLTEIICTSDSIILVLKRDPTISALVKSDEEAQTLMLKITDFILQDIKTQANFKTLKIPVDAKFHGKLIGPQGQNLTDMLGPYKGAVSVIFGQTSSEEKSNTGDKNSITIKGPSEDVTELSKVIRKTVGEFESLYKIIGHNTKISLAPKQAKKVLGASGRSSSWIVRKLRELYAQKKLKLTDSEKELLDEQLNSSESSSLHLSFEIIENQESDEILVSGPKSFLIPVKKLIEEKSSIILDTIKTELNIFNKCSSKSLKAIDHIGGDIKDRIISKIIGKDGKNIKKIITDSNTSINILKESDEGYEIGAVTLEGIAVDVDSAKSILLKIVEDEVIFLLKLIFSS